MRLVEDMTGMTLGKLREFVLAAEVSGTPMDSRVQMTNKRTNKRTGEVTTITLEYGPAIAAALVHLPSMERRVLPGTVSDEPPHTGIALAGEDEKEAQ